MESKTLQSYGAPYNNADPVEDPETEIADDLLNRALEDLAQTTRTIERANLNFTTTAVAHPTTVGTATIDHDTVWGSGVSTRPVITKTGQGLYTITFAASYNDGLAVSETVSFLRGFADAMSSDSADTCAAQILTIAGNVITLKTEAGGALADVGDNSVAVFEVTVGLR